MSVWDKIGVDDWRGILGVLMLGVVPLLFFMGAADLANITLGAWITLVAQYYYSKGE